MVERFAAFLVDRLVRDGVGDRKLEATTRDGEVYIGASDRWVLRVRANAAGTGVVMSALDPSTCQWRDREVRSLADLQASFVTLLQWVRTALAQLTVHRLEKGRRYRIAQAFRDIQGNHFAAGQELMFEALDVLPHDDGYTLRFAERNMWLRGDSEEYARFGLLVVPAR